jgi:uncharacterized membrane protein YfcA
MMLAALPVFLLAAFIQGAVGFGFGMVCMGLLSLLIPVSEAVVTAVLLAAVNNLVLFWRLRAHLRRAEILPLMGGVLVGAPLGVMALKLLDPRWLVLIVGLALVVYASWALTRRGTPEPKGSPRVGLPVGLATGFLGGAAATGGPPVVMYLAWRALPKEVAAATLQALFMFMAFFQIGGYLLTDQLTESALLRAVGALPAIALGLLLGQAAFRRMTGSSFRKATLVGLLALGLVLLGRLAAQALLGAAA